MWVTTCASILVTAYNLYSKSYQINMAAGRTIPVVGFRADDPGGAVDWFVAALYIGLDTSARPSSVPSPSGSAAGSRAGGAGLEAFGSNGHAPGEGRPPPARCVQGMLSVLTERWARPARRDRGSSCTGLTGTSSPVTRWRCVMSWSRSSWS